MIQTRGIIMSKVNLSYGEREATFTEKFMIPPDESKSTEETDEWWSGTEE